jgi:hypothetical protein
LVQARLPQVGIDENNMLMDFRERNSNVGNGRSLALAARCACYQDDPGP